MAEQATESPHLIPRALAEPTEPVTKRWIGTLGLASLAMWMATLTPLQVLLPEQIQHIDPKGKILALGLVSAFGAVSSLLATPIAGAFSDRTTHAWRIGRLRRPTAPLDADHGAARRDLPGADRVPDHRDRHRHLVGAVQRVPERRVRQPERRRPRSRAGEPAGHGGRLGWHAAGARPGARHRPGRLRVHQQGRRSRRYLVLAIPHGRCFTLPFVLAHPRLPAAARAPGADVGAHAARLAYWVDPRAAPGLRLGLDHQVPGLAGDRHGHPVPAVLPARQGALRRIPAQRPVHPDRDLHRAGRRHRDRRRRDLGPDRQAQDDRDGLRHPDGPGRAAAHVRRDLDGRRDRRGAVRRRLRRLPRGRPGADHPGAAGRQRPGQGPRDHQHRDRRARPPWPARSQRCWSTSAATRRCSPPPRSWPRSARSWSGGSRVSPSDRGSWTDQADAGRPGDPARRDARSTSPRRPVSKALDLPARIRHHGPVHGRAHPAAAAAAQAGAARRPARQDSWSSAWCTPSARSRRSSRPRWSARCRTGPPTRGRSASCKGRRHRWTIGMLRARRDLPRRCCPCRTPSSASSVSGCCSACSTTASTPASARRSPIMSRSGSEPPWPAGSACRRPSAW